MHQFCGFVLVVTTCDDVYQWKEHILWSRLKITPIWKRKHLRQCESAVREPHSIMSHIVYIDTWEIYHRHLSCHPFIKFNTNGTTLGLVNRVPPTILTGMKGNFLWSILGCSRPIRVQMLFLIVFKYTKKTYTHLAHSVDYSIVDYCQNRICFLRVFGTRLFVLNTRRKHLRFGP